MTTIIGYDGPLLWLAAALLLLSSGLAGALLTATRQHGTGRVDDPRPSGGPERPPGLL